jgi:hypothetical protein
MKLRLAAVLLLLSGVAADSQFIWPGGGGSSGPGGTPGGTPGQIQYNQAGSFGGFTMGGDCTFAAPNVTCTKTNGTNFGAAATLNVGTGLTSSLGNLNLTAPVTAADGGTGVSNTGTLTLGGNLTTTGAGATSLGFQAGAATYTYPGVTSTLAGLGVAQTWTAAQTLGAGNLKVNGATSGTVTINCVATCGTTTMQFPGTGVIDTVASLAATNAFTAALSSTGTISSTSTTTGFNHTAAAAGTILQEIFRNNVVSATASTQIALGNSVAATEATLTLNSGNSSAINGANAFNLNGNAGVWLLGNGIDGLGVGTTGAITLYSQPTSGTIVYAVCAAANANTTTGGALILDTATTVCGLSGMQFKKDIAAFSAAGQEHLASFHAGQLADAPIAIDPAADVLRLSPAAYTLIETGEKRLGFMAQDVCAVDERLCIRGDDGEPRKFDERGVLALLVATVQKQQREIEELKRNR